MRWVTEFKEVKENFLGMIVHYLDCSSGSMGVYIIQNFSGIYHADSALEAKSCQ